MGHSVVIWAKTAEPVEMPFALWAPMAPGNRVLDGGGVQIPHEKGQFFWERVAHGKV